MDGGRSWGWVFICIVFARHVRTQVTIHTDTLNESGCVEHSIAAFKGRTIHTYHRWAGGCPAGRMYVAWTVARDDINAPALTLPSTRMSE